MRFAYCYVGCLCLLFALLAFARKLLRGIKPPRAEAGEFLVFVFLAVLTLGFFALGTFGFKDNEKGV